MKPLTRALARAGLSAIYWIGAMMWFAIPLFGWMGDWAPGTEPDPLPTQSGALMLLGALVAGWAALLALIDRVLGR